MAKKKIKQNVTFNEGKCPLCGGELEYIGRREFNDSGSSVRWLCTKCATLGCARYRNVFDCHYSVLDDEDYDVEFAPLQVEPTSDDDLLCEAGDVLDNAAHGLIVALSAVPVEWDMSLIAKVKDAVEGVLRANNIPVCIPWEDEDEHICYSLPDERCAHCTRSCTNPDKLTVAIKGDNATVDNQINATVSASVDTKRLAVTMFCQAVYCSSLDVPKNMSLNEAIEYAKAHTGDIGLGPLEFVQDISLDEDNCSFE